MDSLVHSSISSRPLADKRNDSPPELLKELWRKAFPFPDSRNDAKRQTGLLFRLALLRTVRSLTNLCSTSCRSKNILVTSWHGLCYFTWLKKEVTLVQKQPWFSLVDLLVVVAILGIITTLVVPQL